MDKEECRKFGGPLLHQKVLESGLLQCDGWRLIRDKREQKGAD